MNFALILSLLLIIFAIILIFKFVHNIIRAIIFSILLILFISASFGFYIYADFVELREDFPDQDKLVLLTDSNVILAGIVLGENSGVVDSAMLSDFNDYYKMDDNDKILGSYHSVIFIDYAAIDEIDFDDIIISEDSLEKEAVMGMLLSDDPYEMFLVMEKEGRHAISLVEFRESLENEFVDTSWIVPEVEDRASFKGILFGNILVSKVLEKKNPLYFFRLYRENKIEVYPEKVVIKMLKLLPSFLFDKITGWAS